MSNYDVAIIGGGPGGYNAAERAAEHGASVVLFEQQWLGGTCLNEGCIPAKTLLYSAKLYDNASQSEKYGITAENVAISLQTVQARKEKVVRTLTSGVKAALKRAGVEVVPCKATISAHTQPGYTLQADGQSYTAKNVIVASGAKTLLPPIDGLQQGIEQGWVITSKQALQLATPPKSMAVIGAGAVGLELASYYRSLGSEVAVVEMQNQIAMPCDAALAGVLQKIYEKKGVQFHLNASVTSMQQNQVCFTQDEAQKTLNADVILMAAGRVPHTEGLGLQALGAQLQRGALVADTHMCTNLLGLYSIGDVNGRMMLAHAAYREGEVAVNHIMGVQDEMRYDLVPSVIYTNPELSCIGHTELSAKQAGLDVSCVTVPMRYSGRYLAENEGENGSFKLLINKATNTIVGAHALGNYSSEFISALGICMAANMPLQELRKVVFPHPTVGEVLRGALFGI